MACSLRPARARRGLCVGWSALSFGADDAATLLERYRTLGPQLKDNAFHRPLVLESAEASSSLKGDIYAVVDYPYAVVSGQLDDPAQGPANWCAVLILHLNTKYCHASTGSNGPVLDVNLGRKIQQKLPDTYRVQFRYRVATATPDYFQVDLTADSGPMGTKDYRIALEAVPVGASRTFLHLTYSYGFGTVGRMAMKTYLATVGSDKVGFTTVSGGSTAQPQYVGGVRGCWSATRCATTSRSTRFSRRSTSRSTSASRAGSTRPSSIRSNCTRSSAAPICR